MDAPAPFIARGEFIYHDTLFVDVGGALKRHARASPSEIKTLLDGKAPKDQVAHWYEAQLIHYGLQRSKDKNTAKVRLQQALSQKKLSVPAHIVEMEVQMKKEYAANIKKARSAADKATRVGAEDSAVSTGRKRKQSEADPEPGTAASKKTKITMKVGDVEVSIDHDSAGTTRTGTSRKMAKGKTVSGGVKTDCGLSDPGCGEVEDLHGIDHRGGQSHYYAEESVILSHGRSKGCGNFACRNQ